MSVVAMIGCQWGDEGKGKIIDTVAETVTMVVRFQGGSNAGHTIYHQDSKLVLQQLPSGVLHPKALCVLGNGVVVNPKILLAELAKLQSIGIDLSGRFFISDSAHILLPFHIQLDELQENRLGQTKSGKIGTTKQGIGPAYQAKYGRVGLRFMDIFHTETFEEKFTWLSDMFVQQWEWVRGTKADWDTQQALASLQTELLQLKPFITDSFRLIDEHANKPDARIVLEGAQGTFLDIDHGTYPFVTSSNTTIGGAIIGTGLSHKKITHSLGIVKAYSSRVGEGPFPTDLQDEEPGQILRDLGHEYGSNTGRARRCGWLDICMLKKAVAVNGIDYLAITKLDVLDSLPEIKIAVGYTIDKQRTDIFPTRMNALTKVSPIYESVPGWQSKTFGVNSWDDLPVNAQLYLLRIEKLLGVPVAMISTGPKRENIIFRPGFQNFFDGFFDTGLTTN